MQLEELFAVGEEIGSVGLVAWDADRTALVGDRLWVAPAVATHVLLGFDGPGEPSVVIEKRGQGPGEFLRIRRIASGSDGVLHVFADGRHTRLDREGAYIATRAMSVELHRVLELEAGSLLISGSTYTRQAFGRPLHVWTDGGGIRRSFGELPPSARRTTATVLRPLGRAGGPDRFWAGIMDRYLVTLWDTTGTPLIEIDRRAEWFPEWTDDDAVSVWEGVPGPRIVGVQQDEMGHLWTLSLVADPEFTVVSREEFTPFAVFGEDHPHFDSIIEVIDPVSGELLASQRFNGRLYGFMPGGRVIALDEPEYGVQVLRLFEVKLVGEPGRSEGTSPAR